MGAPTYVENNVLSRKAGGNITANRLVKLDSTEGQVVVTTAITDPVFGAALNTVSSGAAVSVETGRTVVKLTAAGAISVGARVMPDGGGGGKIAASSGATALDCGVALQEATGDGQIISVLLQPMGKSPVNT